MPYELIRARKERHKGTKVSFIKQDDHLMNDIAFLYIVEQFQKIDVVNVESK